MGLVVKPQLGLLMPTYPRHFFFQSGPDFIRGKEKNCMRFLGRKNRALLQKYAPTELGDLRSFLAVCVQLARAVARLHSVGLAHADLSPNNVLVDPSSGASFLIDMDSLVVPGFFPPDVLGTKGYTAPEVIATLLLPIDDPRRKLESAQTNLHALAVLFYELLLRRHPLDGRKIRPATTEEERDSLAYGSQALFCEHTGDKSNRPDEKSYVSCSALGPALLDLFHRAFVDGLYHPPARPSADEWAAALCLTQNLLIPCGNPACEDRWLVYRNGEAPVCPRCGGKLE